MNSDRIRANAVHHENMAIDFAKLENKYCTIALTIVSLVEILCTEQDFVTFAGFKVD